MKECTKCFLSKEHSEFNKRSSSKDGLRSECRECQKEQMAAYRKKNPERDKIYYGTNKDEISKRRKQKYPEIREKTRERNTKYYEENREVVLRGNAKWRKNNKDKMRGYRRTYKERHRDRVLVSEHNREAAKRSLLNTLTEPELGYILLLFTNKCAVCLKDYEHLDHFIPLSSVHGGTTKENIVPMCATCNVSKNDRNPIEWAETLTTEQRTNFDKVVEYLAELNELTDDEYREFVFWCFENKRDIDEITDDNRDSLALWKRKKSAA